MLTQNLTLTFQYILNTRFFALTHFYTHFFALTHFYTHFVAFTHFYYCFSVGRTGPG